MEMRILYPESFESESNISGRWRRGEHVLRDSVPKKQRQRLTTTGIEKHSLGGTVRAYRLPAPSPLGLRLFFRLCR